MRLRFLAATLSAAALAVTPAWSRPEQVWAAGPTDQEKAAAWPAEAHGRPGSAAARCKVDAQGWLSDCALLRDYPSAAGFGPALLSLIPKYRLDPSELSHSAPDGRVVVVTEWGNYDKHAGWLHRPTERELLSVYPRKALVHGEDGSAVLNCLAAVDGGLFDCLVIAESPPGKDFGVAALALAPQLVMTPAIISGVPAVESVTIPINFKSNGAMPDPSPPQRMLPPGISWTVAPTRAEVAAAYPADAARARIAGHVDLFCRVNGRGELTECQNVSERPEGAGFGAAARKLARLFRFDVASVSPADAQELWVSLPFTFAPQMLDGADHGVARPAWTHVPDTSALNTAFAQAKPSATSGRAVLACGVRQGGQLGDCTVASETPPGQGLGKTALALQDAFRVGTWTSEGLPVIGQTISVPVRFAFTDPPPAAPPSAPKP